MPQFRAAGNVPQFPTHGCHRSGNGQGKQNSSRSGSCRRILFWVRENWHFEEKSKKIEIVRLSKVGRNISGHMGSKDCCNRRLEAATIS